MSRRRHRGAAVSLPCLIPPGLLLAGWTRAGEPLHQAGLGFVLVLGVLGALLTPGVIVSVEAMPRLLVPNRLRIWWRRGQDHRPTIRAYLRRAVYAADGHRCCWCGAVENLQIDHIRPWSLGGLNALWNLITLCRRCNKIKSNCWLARDGYVFYRPWPGCNDKYLALAILRFEKRHRWNPARWVRAGISLAA